MALIGCAREDAGLSWEESLLTKMVVNVDVGGEGETPGGISEGQEA